MTDHKEFRNQSDGLEAYPNRGLSGCFGGSWKSKYWDIIHPLYFSMNLLRKTIANHILNLSYDVSSQGHSIREFPTDAAEWQVLRISIIATRM